MTERQWLASEDPAKMLRMIDGSVVNGVRLSDRRLRLFACAVARINGHDAESISHVEECVEANQPNHNFSDKDAVDRGQFWRLCTSLRAAQGAAHACSGAVTAALLREVAGSPFRPAYVVRRTGNELSFDAQTSRRLGKRCVSIGMMGHCLLIDSDWLTPTVLMLAQAAYGERVPDGTIDSLRLMMLADALEEAGCAGEAILSHLRSECVPGMGACDAHPHATLHVRGCWALDLILGKS